MNCKRLCATTAMVLLYGCAWAAAEDPGDLNGDLRVNESDMAILSANWLRDYTLPEELPVLEVVSAGISPKAAELLAEALGIDPHNVTIEDGVATYFDKARFQWVPTNPVTDPGIIERLRQGTELDYPDTTLEFRSFDTYAIGKLHPIAESEALKRTVAALNKAELLPELATAGFGHSVFSIVNLDNTTVVEAALDTRVSYQWAINGIPVVGPGARLNVTYDTKGIVTQILYSARTVRPGEVSVQLAPPSETIRQKAYSEGGTVAPSEVRLVYYAPPLSFGDVLMLLPHYDIDGPYWGPDGHVTERLHRLVPAVIDPRFVPQVELVVSVQGNTVTATANVTGGRSPYTYRWASSSCDPDLLNMDVDKVTYYAMPRNTLQETVTIVVTDSGGIEVSATKSVQVAESSSGYPPTGGVSYGTERAVSDMGASIQANFRNVFNTAGVPAEFNWAGPAVWEWDFKLNPAKQELIDSADLVFYIGHGNSGGFTFETQKGDDYLYYPEAHLAWGNGDMEWLCLLSCNVLQGNAIATWGWTFDGLHLLCGFSTVARDCPSFGTSFANTMLKSPVFPIRVAWFRATDSSQDRDVTAKVMGPIGPGGCYSGFDDYFWGKGPVGPDIAGADFNAMWYVTH